VLVVVILVGAAVSLGFLISGGIGGGSPSASHSSSPSGSPVPATRGGALRVVRDFAVARIDRDDVSSFVTKKVASDYRQHTGGLALYSYAGLDILGWYLFHFEASAHGRYQASIDLNLAGGRSRVQESLVLGKGPNGGLVVQTAVLLKS